MVQFYAYNRQYSQKKASYTKWNKNVDLTMLTAKTSAVEYAQIVKPYCKDEIMHVALFLVQDTYL
jgi:hypothetical protein